MLYESNINLDKPHTNYSMKMMKRQNENLHKLLDFFHTVKYKPAGMHKENMTISETFKCNLTAVKRLHSKLLTKDEDIIRLKQTVESKGEHFKRLSEQYYYSQKPVIYQATKDRNNETLLFHHIDPWFWLKFSDFKIFTFYHKLPLSR